MASAPAWITLLDPSQDDVRSAMRVDVLAPTLEELVMPLDRSRLPRPVLETHGAYVFGRLLVPVAVPEENRVF
jgi:hypothetical protein